MRVTHSVMTGWDKIVSIEHLQIHAAVVVVVVVVVVGNPSKIKKRLF